MVYCREIWGDELKDEKFDVKPYQLVRDESGKYTSTRKPLELDPDKKYMIIFLDKTRNDEDKKQILYSFNGRFNLWKELGFCTVINQHQ